MLFWNEYIYDEFGLLPALWAAAKSHQSIVPMHIWWVFAAPSTPGSSKNSSTKQSTWIFVDRGVLLENSSKLIREWIFDAFWLLQASRGTVEPYHFCLEMDMWCLFAVPSTSASQNSPKQIRKWDEFWLILALLGAAKTYQQLTRNLIMMKCWLLALCGADWAHPKSVWNEYLASFDCSRHAGEQPRLIRN